MKKYKFNDEINSELKLFSFHLKEKRLNKNTIRQHRNYAGIFLEWIEIEQIEISQIAYNEIIAFINYLQNKNYNTRFINRILLAVRHFYNYLNYDKNPASNIYLRGKKRLLPNELIDYEKLKELYTNFETKTNREKRNKTMLGLMIFQALTVGELQQLEPGYIDLKKAIIKLPGNKHFNPRVLELNALQLIEIQNYINDIRPMILEDFSKKRSGRKPDKIDLETIENQLFFSENGSKNIKSSQYHLFRKIRKINPEITSNKIIRQSVIAHWLKQDGIRKVQYKAGFKRVESAQRYRDYNMDELSNDLRVFHPLN